MGLKSWTRAICVTACLLGQPAKADELEDGISAYDRGDFATATRLLYPLAKQGDAVAQNNLGQMYFSGLGEPQDYAEAARWFERSAKQGNDLGQFNLGKMYCIDKGVSVDEFKVVKWLTLAAEQGNNFAKMELGSLYNIGCPTTVADLLAHVYGKAAAGTNAEKLPVRLGWKNKRQRKLLAHMWFNLAVAGIPTSDTKNRNEAIYNREQVAKDMTDEEVAEAQGLATKWVATHPQPVAKTKPFVQTLPEFY